MFFDDKFLIGLQFTVILILAALLFYIKKSSSKKSNIHEDRNILTDQKTDILNEIIHTEPIDAVQTLQQLKENKIKLAVMAKESEDKSILLKNLSNIIENGQNNPTKHSIIINEIKRQLDAYHLKDDKIFALQMTELNQENIKKLKLNFPVLTNYDLKLCTLIMAGLNSKEIANSLEVLPSSIYISRSRLRKKLNLENDDDLQGFLTRTL